MKNYFYFYLLFSATILCSCDLEDQNPGTSNEYLVSTFAGSTEGYANGTASVAKFNSPMNVIVDTIGVVYVADGNNNIRKISPQGVTTLAGGAEGYADGTGSAAQFSYPNGLTIDAQGFLYVADVRNHSIRKISPQGFVTTLAGGTEGFVDGTVGVAKFSYPNGVAIDTHGNLYIADTGNNRIRKITPGGTVTTLAGATKGFADGTGSTAQFDSPRDIIVDINGYIYVSDTYNNCIRKVSPQGVVTTFAGGIIGGSTDGMGNVAKFNRPTGLTIDDHGNIYVADVVNNQIRKISPQGMVTTIVGSTYGFAEGTGNTAQFSYPSGLSIDDLGNIYVADVGNHRIRKLTPE